MHVCCIDTAKVQVLTLLREVCRAIDSYIDTVKVCVLYT